MANNTAKKSNSKRTTRRAGRSPCVLPTNAPPVGRKAGESDQSAIPKADVKKIQGLLKSKAPEAVNLGLSLLESLNATRVDYEAVFTATVIKSLLAGWVAESWQAVTILKAATAHDSVSELFRKVSNEIVLNRPAEATKLRDFNFSNVRRTVMDRPSFLAARGGPANQAKPFIDLVSIPAGTFTMGSPANDATDDWFDDEDQVPVRITKSFRIGRTVVTKAQWRAVMGSEPWGEHTLDQNECRNDFPAVYVTWVNAALFCLVITELERDTGRLLPTQAYRLPTEAEWEYACRAGTTTAYSFGDDPGQLGEYAWYSKNASNKLHKVAGQIDGPWRKQPNPWGLFDMHGNVLEWCSDWYDAKLAGGNDPIGPATGSDRVNRGGNFEAPADYCRSACRRDFDFPYRDYDTCGFRVVLEG